MEKTKQKSLNKVYQEFLNTCKGVQEMDGLGLLVDKNIFGYGSALDEKIQGLEGVKKLLQNQIDQSSGLQIQWKVEPFSRFISADGNTAVFADDICMTIQTGEEDVVMYLRLSIVLNYADKKWKVIHWHGSKPEEVESEKDTWGIENWKQKAEALERLVTEKTADLIEKNRELEIESALERVRTVAMAMKQADDMLDICKAISQQLKNLGVKEIRNVQTAIFYPDRGTYMNYEYYANHNKTFITDVEYKNHKIQVAFARKMMKGANEKVVEHLKGDKLKDWYNYQKTTNQFADKYLLNAHSLNYYWYSIGPVALGISTYAPLSENNLELFQRFLNVFELAYRRYLDIEQASAQAKEAQIEAALERIRARALAMHSSDELTDVAKVLREQMGALGQRELETSAVHLYDEDATHILSWRAFRLSSDLEGKISYGFFKIPKNSCAIAKEFIQKFKSKATDYTIEVSGARQTEWYKILFTLAPEVQAAMKKSGTTKEKRYYHFSKFSGGSLLMVSSKEPSNDAIELQKRAAQVFDLAYRRFKDLQKAEAQAREAQIEAALERIRAASLAMQESSILGEIIYKLYGELTKLDTKLDRCFIMIVNPANKGITWWMAGFEGLLAENGFFVQMNQHPSHLMYLDHSRKRKKKWTYLFEGKEKRDWDRFGFTQTELSKLPEPIKAFMAAAKQIHLSGSSDQFGSLVTGSFEPLPEEQQEIISRFAIIFNQAYIRFLDLQKAEAQAKEAAIELGLERVRARAMSMQHSDELAELVATVFTELNKLEFSLASCIIWIHGPADKSNALWIASEEMNKPARPLQIVPFYEPFFTSIIAAWKAKDPKWIYSLTGTQKKKFQTLFFKHYPQLPEALRKPVSQNKQITFSASFNNFGALEVVGTEPLTNEKFNILHRFGNVFNSSYTRFNDLQKAEAQARESQIQLALERVRARTMAMQKSEELPETSNILFQQMKELGEPVEQLTIGIVNEENRAIEISATLLGGTLKKIYNHSIDEPYMMTKVYKAWKRQQKTLVVELRGDELNAYNQYRNALTKSKMFPTNLGKDDRRIVYAAFFSKGMLALGSNETRPPESMQLLEKFASVFDLTYTRFLDLQKAEAQAREAQIQLALERVRARTMAMQHSEELADVSYLLNKQVVELGIPTRGCAFNIYNEHDATEWFSNLDGTLPAYKTPRENIFLKYYEAGRRGETLWIEEFSKERIRQHYKYLYSLGYFGNAEGESETLAKVMPASQVDHVAFFKYGYLLFITLVPAPEAHDIFKRFAKEFEQTYTRFLDLQKAEAQAREAQIEAALEKVRSRSMAMQKPEELTEVAELLRKEMGLLGVEELETSSIYIVDKEKKQTECWYAIKDVRGKNTKLVSDEMTLTLADTWVGKQMWKFYHSANEQISILMAGENRKEWINYCAAHSSVLEGYYGDEIPDRSYHLVKFSGGFMGAASPASISAVSWDLLHRLATVFSLAYTRFKDLQDAATRAREAQIELALERVRSRSMQMHKSEELKDVIKVVLEQFVHLNINVGHAGFYIDYKAHDDMHIWLADPNIEPFYATLPYFDTPTWNSYLEAKAKGTTLHTDLLDFKTKNKFYRTLFKLFAVPEEAQQFYLQCKGLAVSTVLLDTVGLYIENFSATPYTDEENEILIRIGKVFQQTYTRFLDLQKAEEQAREAEIQLALERVRARSLAMHHTNELQEVVNVVAQQLMQMGIDMDGGVFIVINSEVTHDLPFWAAAGAADYLQKVVIPFLDKPIYKGLLGAIKERKPLLEEYYSKKEKDDLLNHMFRYPPWKENSIARKKALLAREGGYARSVVVNRHTTIGMTNHHGKKFSEKDHDILERFGAVLEQSYTRFLDLQKAEAQAKEARIESALERVRSRSLAMHHSSELSAVVDTLLREFTNLEFTLTFCIINLIDEQDRSNTVWAANPETGKDPESYYMKFEDYPFHHAMWNAWKQQKKNFIYTLEGEEKKVYDEYLFTKTEFRRFPKHVQEANKALKRYVAGFTFFKHSGLQTVSENQVLEDDLKILERFGRVFEQSYTRFLDLQKAEAQAREAEIQLALERVRARAMAMQKSDELAEAATILFQQVKALGIDTYASGFTIWENDDKDLVSWMCSADGSVNPPFRMPALENDWHRQQYESWKRGDEFIMHDFAGREMQDYYAYLRSFPLLNESFKKSEAAGVPTPGRQVHNAFNFTHGNLLFITLQTVPEAHDIFIRFATVFDQTYTRFLDLQKAEAQAREAQIEAALERVRSRTMGMQKSTELNEVAFVLFEQIRLLGGQLWGTGFALCNASEGEDEFWFANEMGVMPPVSIPSTVDEVHVAMLQGWEKNGDYLLSQKEGEALAAHYRYLYSLPQMKAFFDPMLAAGFEFPAWQQWHAAYFSKGYLLFITTEPYAEPDIFKRFAKVFDQTYTRFLDLQKAEAQAREAQIETALERVRSKAMAMHNSADLPSTAIIAFSELKKLGFVPIRCGISIQNKESRKNLLYSATSADHADNLSVVGWATLDHHPILAEIYNQWLLGNDYYPSMKGKVLQAYYKQIQPTFHIPLQFPDEEQFGYFMHFTHGTFYGWCKQAITDDEKKLLKRFASVVDLTFKRYFDLQKSEAQARESQIQLALERVRARTMAMQKSDELPEAAAVLFEQFKSLGQDILQMTIGIVREEDGVTEFNVTDWGGSGASVHKLANIKNDEPTLISKLYNGWKEKKKSITVDLKGKDLENWLALRKEISGVNITSTDTGGRRVIASASFSKGHLSFSSPLPPDTESIELLERFALVFDSTYTRFLDLQRAEAQAREAQIEAALERVRAKATAMHSTKELKEVVHELRKQMGLLGQKGLETCVIHLHEESEDFIQSWAGINPPAMPGKMVESIANVPKKGLLIIEEALHAYATHQQEYVLINEGKKLKQWFSFLQKEVPDAYAILSAAVQGNIEQLKAFWSFADFAGGSLLMVTLDEPDEPTRALLRRFSNVFGLAYRRFADLKQAEAQAREAQIEAALEKVRSRTLAMQKSDELAGTAAVLFQQLIVLGIAPNRLFIILIKEDMPQMEAWLTDEDGSKVSMGFTGNYLKNASLLKMYEGWKAKRKTLVIDMQGAELQQYFHYLHDELNVPFKGGLEQKRRVQHLAYFSHGMIGMASPDEQPVETLELLERFAAVFNLTFTRFNDLKIAEAHALQAEQDLIAIKEAKQKAELALTELQATQKQLVQSEKMASLGELTAGIAHEIQNPLNFVNNFSEVSKELLEEMREAIEKGDHEEAREIMEDVIRNLEKINHHGKRADGIVKGMLQHSRSSSGQREKTDINDLCDEYLRLAYHGLRAKDKSFNAHFETELDPEIGLVEVIPQEIGRVVLNLINNAFYAVNARKKSAASGYVPTVKIATAKQQDKIEIRVADNGTGIPASVKEKIFQPFFTTKPTGQGTGLGLSLSYDIVKAHGGELRVDTKEKVGTTFIIQIPFT